MLQGVKLMLLCVIAILGVVGMIKLPILILGLIELTLPSHCRFQPQTERHAYQAKFFPRTL